MRRNPFDVLSPEQLDSAYIAANFIDVFTDLPRITDQSNTFIAGARGTGKSMLLRSLEPEVMLKIGRAANLKDLPYLSVHVPLRKAEFGVTELRRLAGYASVAIGEHLLSMQVAFRLATLLESLANSIETNDAVRFSTQFDNLFKMAGGKLKFAHALAESSATNLFQRVKLACEAEIIRVRQYYTRIPFSTEKQTYHGGLAGFLDFVVPLASEVTKFSAFSSVPLFVMLDDADNLPLHLQRVINSWVSTRSTHAICLKITTQLGYATLRTIDNRIIESPHDFTDVNLSSIYTSEYNTYSNRIAEIVKRRLELANIDRTVDEFFPRDEAQAKRLAEIQREIEGEHKKRVAEQETQIGASRSRDEVGRYAVPRLMRELAGASRSSHTYSYAGFRSVVDLSSGVIRWFLEPASRMYDLTISKYGENVDHIPVSIQDGVLIDWATEFIQKLSAAKIDALPDELDGANEDASLHAIGHESELYERLRNVLDGLGLLFRHRLLDDKASEQRAFSIVLRDKPSSELRDVLELGVRLGYFQKADNAAKETVGIRLPRYVLARRLGPHYRLDVSGYAAHLSVMAGDLEIAMRQPYEFVRRRLKQPDADSEQLALDLGQN
jgi:hypothetical protein